MSRFRIALFTGNYNHIKDGVSLTLNRLVRYLESRGTEVLVFAPTVENPALDHAGRLVSVPSIPMPGRPEYRITTGFPKSAVQELENFRPDFVHIATPDVLGFRALKWSRRAGIPVVSSYHTHFTSYLSYYKLGYLESLSWHYLRWFYAKCRQVYVPTQSMLDYLIEKKIKGDLRIWSRGVDTNLFNPEKRDADWREQHGFKPDDVVVTFVSRLVWEKNLSVFVETVQQAARETNRIKAMIVGDGPASEELRERMPEAVYTGFLEGEELARSYASSDIFLFPSETETFGNVTLEAMASGLPCVVADAVGSRSLVQDRENGYVIDLADNERFVRALVKLSDDGELRQKMKNSSVLKSESYAWENVNNQLFSYYEELMRSAPAN